MDQFTLEDWHEYAQCYDFLLELTPYRELLTEVARFVCTFRDANILDAACGTGNLVHFVAKERSRFPPSCFFCLDHSRAMLAVAEQKKAALEAEYVQATLDERLPFSNGVFGCVASINTLYAVRDPRFTLREFHRTLQKDGMLILTTFKEGSENGYILKAHCKSSKPDEYWRDMHATPQREEQLIREALLNPAIASQALMVARLNRQINLEKSFHFFTRDTLMSLLRSSGFSVVRCVPIYAGQCFLIVAYREEDVL